MFVFLQCAVQAEVMGISQVLESNNRLNPTPLRYISCRGTVTLKEMDAAPASVNQVSGRVQFHITRGQRAAAPPLQPQSALWSSSPGSLVLI